MVKHRKCGSIAWLFKIRKRWHYVNGKQIYKRRTLSYTKYCDHRSLSENKSLPIYSFLLWNLGLSQLKLKPVFWEWTYCVHLSPVTHKHTYSTLIHLPLLWGEVKMPSGSFTIGPSQWDMLGKGVGEAVTSHTEKVQTNTLIMQQTMQNKACTSKGQYRPPLLLNMFWFNRI